MSKQIFREKSMEKITSPEQLNEYIKVANPSLWFVLGALLILLAGACVWGVLGHLDTKIPAMLVGENDSMYLYLQEEDALKIQPGMTVLVAEKELVIENTAPVPMKAKDAMNEYGLHVSGLSPETWVYQVSVSGDYIEGIMAADVVIERIAPMNFIFN